MQTAAETKQPSVLKLRQVASALNCSTQYVHKMTKIPADDEGSIPHSRLGKQTVYLREEIELWIKMGFPTANEVLKVTRYK